MKICIAGKNSIAVNACQWLLESGQVSKSNLLACVNRTDSGVDNFQPSFKAFCEKNNITVAPLENLVQLEELIFFSLEYDQIIPVKRLISKRLYNIHFSLLPKYRGVYTSAWPILNNEKQSGVTLHEIDEGIDSGNSIAQRTFDLSSNMTARDLYFAYLNYGFKLFKDNYQVIVNGEFQSVEQDENLATYYDKNSIDYSKATLRFNCNAEDVVNQVRAFTFKEFQLPKFNEKNIIKNWVISCLAINSLG